MPFEAVVIVAIVLVVVTMIGHGIWVTIAWVIRQFTQRQAGVTDRTRARCPVCQTQIWGASQCAGCGWSEVATSSSSPLAIAANQVESLLQRGLVDRDAGDHVISILLREQSRPSHSSTPAVSADRSRAGTAARPGEDVAAPAEEIITAQLVTSPQEPSIAPTSAHQEPTTGERGGSDATPPEPATTASPAERVREYAARRQQVDQLASPPDAQQAGPRRKPWGQLLAAFMEEKNIRWGELIGGLLIVSCSIALVISFWAKIAEHPFLKFGIFNGLTGVLFAVGFHAARRWKLPTTSQGLLIIAALLVPLNFLAIAAFSGTAPPSSLWAIGGEILSVMLFAVLVYHAGKTIVTDWPLALTVGVIAQSIVQLLVRRFVGPTTPLSVVYATGSTSALCYVGVNALVARALRKEVVWSETRANEIFKFLGITSFAAILPLGLLLLKTEQIAVHLRHLSPLTCLLGVPAFLLGTILARRATTPSLSSMRTAGMAIGVGGVVILLSGVLLAWPQPATLVASSLLAFVALSAVAIRIGIPEAHFAAAPCFAMAYLLLWHVATGRLAWHVHRADDTVAALYSAASGTALVGFALLYGAVASWFRHVGRTKDGAYHGILALAAAACSLVLVSIHGFAVPGDPAAVTWVYAFYATAGFAVAAALRKAIASWIGGALLLAAMVQGVVYRFAGQFDFDQPWLTALMLHATMVAIGAAVTNVRGSALRKPLVIPLSHWVLVSSAMAVGVIAWNALTAETARLALYVAWLAVVWLSTAWVNRWAWLFAGFQVALATSLILAVNASLETTEWYASLSRGWFDPWCLQLHGIALAVYCLGFVGIRAAAGQLACQRGNRPAMKWAEDASHLLNPPWASIDRVVTAGVVALMALLAIYAVVPGAAQELSPRWQLPASEVISADVAVVKLERIVPPASLFELAGIPHQHALHGYSWLLLGVTLTLVIAGLREQFKVWKLAAVAITASSACLLLAGRWESQFAVASALRWYSAGLFGVGSVAIWCGRPLLERFGKRREYLRTVRGLLLVLGTAPLLAVTLFVVGAALFRHPIVGPVASSFFAQIGLSVSYALPILVIALALIGHAVSLRSARLALAAGLVLGFCATAAYLLFQAGPGPMQTLQWIRLAQINAIVSAGYGLIWIGALRWRKGTEPHRTGGDGPLVTQIALGGALCALFVIPVVGCLFLNPQTAVPLDQTAGLYGWSALILSAIGGLALVNMQGRAVPVSLFSAMAAGIAALIALQSHRWDSGDWLAYHTLMIASWAVAWSVLAWGWILQGTGPMASACRSVLEKSWGGRLLGPTRVALNDQARLWEREGEAPAEPLAQRELRPPITALGHVEANLGDRHSNQSAAVTGWTSAISVLIVMLALRAIAGDPDSPWWTVAGLVSASAIGVGLACWSKRRGLLYVAGVLLNLAATVWWLATGHSLLAGASGPAVWMHLVGINILVLAIPVPLWLAIEVRLFSRADQPDRQRLGIGSHRVAAGTAVLLLSLLVALSIVADAVGAPLGFSSTIGWLALGATGVALCACLWDRRARLSMAGLYLVGLNAIGLFLDPFDLPVDLLGWTGTMVLAAYGLGTSYLGSRRGGLLQVAQRLGVPHHDDREFAGMRWLVAANCTLAVAVTYLGIWVQLTFAQFPLRLSAAQAVMAQAFAIGLLARGQRRSTLQITALWWGVVGAVAIGWAWLNPMRFDNWINHLVVVAVALAGMTALYGVGLLKLLRSENEWTRAAQRLVPSLVCLGMAAILTVLGLEVTLYVAAGSVPIAWPAIVAVAVALLGLAAAGLVAALVPGRDPLGLSPRRRMVYVYAAEALLALLLVHVRLTMPWLFSGFFQQYWPLIVMLIAYVGVGLSEWCRRAQQMVLAEPLEKTGALLPLLPVVGYWVAPADIHFSFIMLVVGTLYAGLSVMRRSFGFGILAALAANGGLWYLLARAEGLDILDHPQLWLIPPSLCILIAAYLNRDRMSPTQMTSVRYLTSTVVYTASTADIFLNGVAQAPWLPFVLAGLSLVGIFAGIMLRVRAFLFLGTSFLTLALITVIWYAAVDRHQTWLWFVTGIVAGILIIAVFAVFEKKRQEVLLMVERLKEWDA